MEMFQGGSAITPQKELGFYGICDTRLSQRKYQKYIRSIFLCDVFSGDGHNVINGEELEGSPIKMAKAVDSSGISEFKDVFLLCSDIRDNAVQKLTEYFNRSNHTCKTSIYKNDAAKQLRYIHGLARKHINSHFIITIDPNGPKALPFDEIKNLSRDPLVKKRVDFIVNVSATSIKRMIGHMRSGKVNYEWWINAVQSIGEDIIMEIAKNYRGAWIRKPIDGDKQGWLMVAYFNWSPPINDWNKRGFLDLHTINGQKALLGYEVKK